jgi:UDP-N-acetylmuramate dehydrogenase
MSTSKTAQEWPPLRGKLRDNARLGEAGWFKCGGRAARLFKPEDVEDLQQFLAYYSAPSHQPSPRGGEGVEQSGTGEGQVHTLGVLSNTIVRDGGLDGTALRLGREFATVEPRGHNQLYAGAAALDSSLAKVAADNGIAGLEFYGSIPGTIGGALRMNAGCYGTETKDVLIEAYMLDCAGVMHKKRSDEMGMAYRHCDVPGDMIFIGALFEGEAGDPTSIQARIDELRARREATQPIQEKTGGSTFANPTPEQLEAAGIDPATKVWQLIDRVGGRGLTRGGARMSDKHCNFMINTGAACAADLENLGEEVRKRVYETFGIALRWEIMRIGNTIDK